jgi:hypothetical protein
MILMECDLFFKYLNHKMQIKTEIIFGLESTQI